MRNKNKVIIMASLLSLTFNNPFANAADVSAYTEWKAAITNAAETTINVTSDFDSPIAAYGARPITQATNLVINGNNNTITGNPGGTIGFQVKSGTTVQINNLNIDTFNVGFINFGNVTDFTGSIKNSHAGSNGGAIQNLDSSTIGTINATFLNNTAALTGGAIYNRGNIDNITSYFEGNHSNDVGGAISNIGSLTPGVIIGYIKNINSTFVDNSSSKNGGAISSWGVIENLDSVFKGNHSDAGGGAISNEGLIQNLSGEFYNNTAAKNGGAILNKEYGTIMNIIADDKDTIFTGNTDSGGSNAIHNLSELNMNAGDKNIIINDGISGDSTGTGIININSSSIKPGLTTGTIEFNNTVTGNTINLYDGTLKFGSNTQGSNEYYGTLGNDVNLNYFGGTIDTRDNSIHNTNLGNLTLNADMDLKVDANFGAIPKAIDTITVNSFTNTGSHNINISDINILSPTTDKNFSLSIFGDATTQSALQAIVQYTGGELVYSPIYKYTASYDPATGLINFGLVNNTSGGGSDNYNPAILASPVATQLGGYLTQLNSYDEAFRNMDMYMLMTKKQRDALKLKNKAASSEIIRFDKANTPYSNTAGWIRPYTTFESVRLKNGPKVSNVAYGSFFGGESDMKDLGNGWDGIIGAYVGYNGSHQAFNNVNIYQNGGTLGVVGMAYKGNYFVGATLNAGANAGEAHTMYGQDNFSMLMAGVAAKTGYNFELADGKFIIQPHYLMSYSFVNTFDYTNSAGVRIDSDPLNAIHIEPGIKFIGNLQNGWQPYASVSMVWNIMDQTRFKANDVTLPDLSIKPFVKYGIGIRKTWGDRFVGYFQTYLTNGGRNGVGLQLGFRWTLGKTTYSEKTARKELERKPTTINFNNIKTFSIE